MKSRVKGDFQARFRENVRVKFPCVTRLAVILPNDRTNSTDKDIEPHRQIYYLTPTYLCCINH